MVKHIYLSVGLLCPYILLANTASESTSLDEIARSIEALSFEEQMQLLEDLNTTTTRSLSTLKRSAGLPDSLSAPSYNQPDENPGSQPRICPSDLKHKYTTLIVTNGQVFNPFLPATYESSSAEKWNTAAATMLTAFLSTAIGTLTYWGFGKWEKESNSKKIATVSATCVAALATFLPSFLLLHKNGASKEDAAIAAFIQHWPEVKTTVDWPVQMSTLFDALHEEYEEGVLSMNKARAVIQAIRTNTGR
jgi:hypothetical protein